MTVNEGVTDQPEEKPKRAYNRKKPIEPAIDPAAVLWNLLEKANLDHAPTTDAERASKISIAEKDADHERQEKKSAADHRRRVELISLISVLVTAALICPVCLWTLSDPNVPSEKKMWASPLLTLIVGGLIGFLTGRIPTRPADK